MQNLKQRVGREFGYKLEQLQVYLRYEMIRDMVMIQEISAFSLDEDILQVIGIGESTVPFRNVVRAPLAPIKIADVRMFNTKFGTSRDPTGKAHFGKGFKLFNIDDSKVSEPYYVDFYSACKVLSKEIINIKG